MTDQDTLNRAAVAREIFEHPLMTEALEAYEKEITEAWKQSPLRDAEGRERLRLMLEAQQKFKQFLLSTIESGKLVQIKTPSKLRQVVGGW